MISSSLVNRMLQWLQSANRIGSLLLWTNLVSLTLSVKVCPILRLERVRVSYLEFIFHHPSNSSAWNLAHLMDFLVVFSHLSMMFSHQKWFLLKILTFSENSMVWGINTMFLWLKSRNQPLKRITLEFSSHLSCRSPEISFHLGSGYFLWILVKKTAWTTWFGSVFNFSYRLASLYHPTNGSLTNFSTFLCVENFVLCFFSKMQLDYKFVCFQICIS